jgi:hypothetical protein
MRVPRLTTRRWMAAVAAIGLIVALVREYPIGLIVASELTALFGPILGGGYLRSSGKVSSVRKGAIAGAISSMIALGLLILWGSLTFPVVPRHRFGMARFVYVAGSGVVSIGTIWGAVVGLVAGAIISPIAEAAIGPDPYEGSLIRHDFLRPDLSESGSRELSIR